MDSLLQNRQITLFLVMGLGLLCGCTTHQRVSPKSAIPDAVHSLGRGLTNDETLKSLESSPRGATEVLIKELRVIPDEVILPDDFAKREDSMHVIWCLRALRYLTHTNFTAQSTYAFGDTDSEDARKQFLTKKHKSELTFYGTWMSRDAVYVAPADAQKKIIEKWKEWYHHEGRKKDRYSFAKPAHIDDWYF